MPIGTKIRTLYYHSETGVIVKPTARQRTPNAEWFIVRWDVDGKKACIHRSMMVIRND